MSEPVGNSAPEDPEVAGLVAEAGALGAWRFAAEAHAGQLRTANLAPYIHHPERVAVLVAAEGADAAMVAAALLHDVLEDSAAEPAQVSERFGDDIGDLVTALSDDRSIADYEQRKGALREQVRRAGERAALIYAADKLANCRDLRAAYAEVGEAVADRLPIGLEVRTSIWRDDARMCGEVLGESEPVTLLRVELDALERDRAAAPAESQP